MRTVNNTRNDKKPQNAKKADNRKEDQRNFCKISFHYYTRDRAAKISRLFELVNEPVSTYLSEDL